jgi:hypothetical protein
LQEYAETELKMTLSALIRAGKENEGEREEEKKDRVVSLEDCGNDGDDVDAAPVGVAPDAPVLEGRRPHKTCKIRLPPESALVKS